MFPLKLLALLVLGIFIVSPAKERTHLKQMEEKNTKVLQTQPVDSVLNSIDQLLLSRKCSRSGVGVVIRDVENDSIVVSVNQDLPYNPASVNKLVTAAAAYELLGTNYYFNTRVFTTGKFDISTGTLHGDVYVVGAGDPGFTAERMWLFVQQLYYNGLRKIKGNLILDDFYFDSTYIGPGFDEDTSSRAYSPLIGALSANFSTVAVYQRPGEVIGAPVHIELFPKMKHIELASTAKTIKPGKNAELDIMTMPKAKSTVLTIRGGMSLDKKTNVSYHKLWQTCDAFGDVMVQLMDEAGMDFRGKVLHERTPDTLMAAVPFLNFQSMPISEFVQYMFKYSSNFAAEMIYKTLSACSDSLPGSWDNSTLQIRKWWSQCGLPGDLAIKNGSGMGNTNRLSALQITALLDHVWKQKSYLPDYLAALSTSGIDGTLKSRFKNSNLKGIVRGKTGTLNSYGVSTLAGYMFLPRGTYSFAILCNDDYLTQYENWMLQESILEKVAAQLK